MHTTNRSLRLLRLLQLASSNLPVGGYTFSQGLEFAIDSGWLTSVAAVEQWIEQSLHVSLAYADIPVLKRQYHCIEREDYEQFIKWNQTVLAMRETRELLLADKAMGNALIRLLVNRKTALPAALLQGMSAMAMPSAFSLAASDAGLELEEACLAYSWTALENQVMAATKLLPMGQTQAQQSLAKLSPVLMRAVSLGLNINDETMGMSLPGVAMASAKHETQYSRLYRS